MNIFRYIAFSGFMFSKFGCSTGGIVELIAVGIAWTDDAASAPSSGLHGELLS